MQAPSKKPLVSVIMPVYNAAPYLKQAIDSILEQTYLNFELLICDDASTDNSPKIIAQFKDERIRLFSNQSNLGYLKTCNFLFKEAKGDIITFQDADDWSEQKRLELSVDVFETNPKVSYCLSYYNKVNKNGALIEKRDVPFDTHAFGYDLSYWEYFCGASIAVKREVLESVGGYKEYFDRIGGEDYDWLFRIANKFKGIQLKHALYNYRQHNSVLKESNDWKRHYILDLIKEGRTLWLKEGKDYLAPENKDWLEAKNEELSEPFKKDPNHLLKIKAVSQLNSDNKSGAIATAFKAFRLKPFSFKSLIFFLKLNYWTLRRLLKF